MSDDDDECGQRRVGLTVIQAGLMAVPIPWVFRLTSMILPQHLISTTSMSTPPIEIIITDTQVDEFVQIDTVHQAIDTVHEIFTNFIFDVEAKDAAFNLLCDTSSGKKATEYPMYIIALALLMIGNQLQRSHTYYIDGAFIGVPGRPLVNQCVFLKQILSSYMRHNNALADVQERGISAANLCGMFQRLHNDIKP